VSPAADQTVPGVSLASGEPRRAEFGELLARLAGKRPSRSPDEATEAAVPKRESTTEEPACFDAASILGPVVAVTTPVVPLAHAAGETAENAGEVNDGPVPEVPASEPTVVPCGVESPGRAAVAQAPVTAPQPTAETSPPTPAGLDNDPLRAPAVPARGQVELPTPAGVAGPGTPAAPDTRATTPMDPSEAGQAVPDAGFETVPALETDPAETMTLADGTRSAPDAQGSKGGARPDVRIVPDSFVPTTFRAAPVAAELAGQLNRLSRTDQASDQPGRLRRTTGETEVLAALIERGPAARPAGDLQGATARRLEAYLVSAWEPAVHAAAWRVAAASTLAAATTRQDQQPLPDVPSTTGRAGPVDLLEAVVLPGLPADGFASAAAIAPTTAAVPTDGPAEAQVVVPQIVKAIRLQWKQGLGEARIRLEPEHLGEVRVSLRVQAGAVTAVVTAENPTVQAWIETRQQELKNALGEQGLRLQRFEVVVDPEGRRQSREAPPDAAPRRQRRNSSGVREFEVPV
jgi:flagellar hook-length control protein FliK